MRRKKLKSTFKRLFHAPPFVLLGFFILWGIQGLEISPFESILTPIQTILSSSTPSLPSSISLEAVTLKRVVDGDTIIVLDNHHTEIRVRLIGVDTPESVHVDESKNTLAGMEASEYTKSQLKAGQTLYLEYDKERLDPYGRTLAYVWLKDKVDPSNLNDIQSHMYNAKLLVEGYAVAKNYPPNTKYSTIFKSLTPSN